MRRLAKKPDPLGTFDCENSWFEGYLCIRFARSVRVWLLMGTMPPLANRENTGQSGLDEMGIPSEHR
jgi:hypothetical protein